MIEAIIYPPIICVAVIKPPTNNICNIASNILNHNGYDIRSQSNNKFKMGQRYWCDINTTVINIQQYEIHL